MKAHRVRFVEFERGQIDMETGEFPMILATDGEASDGDILSIEGASFTSRAPLQLSHINDPTATLGTVSGFRRELTGTPKRLRARGQIELNGEGPNAEIRRDLAHMIQQGHVTGVSVRWEPLRFQRRSSLPKEHPAFVKEDEPDFRKRTGLFHERWRVLEGSIVAVQADKAAMIGRADETEGEVSAFWRAMADDAKPLEEFIPEPDCEPIPPTAESIKAAFAAQVRELREQHGIALDELEEILEEQRPKAEPTLAVALAEISTLRAELEVLKGRVDSGPSPQQSLDVAAFMRGIKAQMEEQASGMQAGFRAYLDAERGRVLNDEQQAALARVRDRVERMRSGESQ